jgi:hypothetical protein
MTPETKEVSTEEAKPVESKPEEGKTEEVQEATAGKGTTDALFSDFLEEGKPEETVAEVIEKAEKEVPAKAEESEQLQTIDLDSFGDSIVKTKVSGVESDVKMKDLVRAYQTDSYLTQKGQRLAEQEKALNEKAAALNPLPAQESKPAAEELSEESKWVRSEIQPELDKRDEQIANLQRQLEGIQESTRDVAYESMLVRADKSIKGKKVREDGTAVFDDFKDYVPKIESFISSLPAEDQKTMLNDMGYISIYNEMKMSDLVTGSTAPKKAVKPSAEVRPKPKLKKIPVVESGLGTPTGASGENTSYEKAFDKARDSGRTEDWMSVFEERFPS